MCIYPLCEITTELTENVEVEGGRRVIQRVLGHARVEPLIVHSHSTQLEKRADKRDSALRELIGEDGDGGIIHQIGVLEHPGDVWEGVAIGNADEYDGGVNVCLGVVGSYSNGWSSWGGGG